MYEIVFPTRYISDQVQFVTASRLVNDVAIFTLKFLRFNNVSKLCDCSSDFLIPKSRSRCGLKGRGSRMTDVSNRVDSGSRTPTPG